VTILSIQYSAEYIAALVWLFALGASFGSMLSVWVHRLPQHDDLLPALRSLASPPSHCPKCGNRVHWSDNIPIIGWLRLRGRCRSCGLRIPIRYPLMEFLTGALFVAVYCAEIPPTWFSTSLVNSSIYHPFGPAGDAGSTFFSPLAVQHWRYAFHMAMIVALIAATFIDIDHRIIPDSVTVPAMLIGFLGNTLLGCVYLVPALYATTGMATYTASMRFMLSQAGIKTPPGWLDAWLNLNGVPAWMTAHPHWHGLLVSLLGFLIGGGVVWVVRIVGFWALKKEAMGFGDVMLMAMIGSFIGWQPVLVVFFVAPVCALVMALFSWLVWKDREIPYGPYLSLATLVLLVAWKPLWPVVENGIFALGPLLPVAALFMTISLGALLVLTRAVQKWLGILPDEDLPEFEWGPGDQLAYLACEQSDQQQGQWDRPLWPGTRTARGQSGYHNWRHAAAPTENHSGWKQQRLSFGAPRSDNRRS
jgi:leader peptidase (prepilin peptidase) / N-methyltransferase